MIRGQVCEIFCQHQSVGPLRTKVGHALISVLEILPTIRILATADFREPLADEGGKMGESSAAIALSVMLLRLRRSARGRSVLI
jgi:hypothetical protein